MAELPFPRSLIFQSWGFRTLNGRDDYHKGTDFGRGIANVAGTPVPCVADGFVTEVGGPNPSYQHYVQIEHARDSSGRRWWTRHHMLSGVQAPQLHQRVSAGQIIGRIAPAGGVTTGVHHHFELHTDDTSLHIVNYATSVDAEDFIGRVPVTSAPSSNPTTTLKGKNMYIAWSTTGGAFLFTEKGRAPITNLSDLDLVTRLLKSDPAKPDTFNQLQIDILTSIVKSAA